MGNGDGGGVVGDGGGPPVTVMVAASGSGSGTITSAPAGISCGGGGACSAEFATGTQITLTAQGTSSSFTGWTGACAGQSAICQLTVSGPISTTASFNPLTCTPDFICWEAPLPFGIDLNDVYAIAGNNVWAVGNGGSIVHYDGNTWQLTPSGTTNDLPKVWARNSNEVWAVAGLNAAGNGAMVRYNGTSWGAVDTGQPYATTAVWGDNTNLLFVPTNTYRVLHYNGTAWTAQNSNARASVAQLTGVTGTSGTDVWVYGGDLSISHWNGNAYTLQPRNLSPVSLWSAAPNDVWGIGPDGTVYRYQGSAYNSTGQKLGGTAGGVKGMWGTSDTNIFSSGPPGLIYQFNGTTWNSLTTGAADGYSNVHGTGSSDVWAVGPRGIIAHYDGQKATLQQRANVFSGDIVAVWGSSVNDIWFVTNNSTVVHYNGLAYTESAQLVSGPGAQLNSVGGSGPNDVWVTGTEYSQSTKMNSPALLHWNGTTWAPTPTLPSTYLLEDPTSVNLIYAANASDVWASGTNADNLLHFDGTSWTIDTSFITGAPPTAMWGTAPNNIWIADGDGTKLWNYNGSTWIVDTRVAVPIYSLGGTGPSDVWAGTYKAVYHYNGSAWTMMNVTGSTQQIISISATTTSDAWFVENLTGGVFRWNGTSFTRINTGQSTGPDGVIAIRMSSWAADPHDVWFGGRGILSYRH